MHQGGLGTLISPVVSLPTVQRNLEQAAPRGNAHPFKVTKATGDNLYQVRAGTCEGELITTQTIDVGATRPVAILAKPQYDLSIDGGEFVSGMTVRTGADAPVLVTSTTTLGDVSSGITAVGNEARALIAYIDEDENIWQIAMGNIAGVWGVYDDGTLTAKAAGIFNKNY